MPTSYRRLTMNRIKHDKLRYESHIKQVIAKVQFPSLVDADMFLAGIDEDLAQRVHARPVE